MRSTIYKSLSPVFTFALQQNYDKFPLLSSVKEENAMPTYEYRCQRCQHQFEIMQKISESPLTICPSCSAPGLEKLISATSFQLKGEGWYKSGYQKPVASATPPKAEAPGKPATETAAKSTPKATDAA